MCVKKTTTKKKNNKQFFHSSGPRAVQDGSGGAMGLQLHSCLLLLMILPFLLRVWRGVHMKTSVCLCECVFVWVCVWMWFFLLLLFCCPFSQTGTINWCTVSAQTILLCFNFDTVNQCVTLVIFTIMIIIIFLFIDFGDITSVSHFSVFCYLLSQLYCWYFCFVFFMAFLHLQFQLICPHFLTALLIYRNSKKTKSQEMEVKYLKYKQGEGEAEWSRMNLGHPEAKQPSIIIF